MSYEWGRGMPNPLEQPPCMAAKGGFSWGSAHVEDEKQAGRLVAKEIPTEW